jgi:F-type H+-transporting ATPase subunit b
VKKITSRTSTTRILLAGLTLALLLSGAGLRGTRALAQETAGASSSGPQAAGDSAKNDSAKSDQSSDDTEAYRKSATVISWGRKLGMNPEQSANAFDIGNFLILALAVGWLLVKFVPKTLRERSATIQKDLTDARTATEEAHTRLNSVEERLGKLDGEIAALKTRSEKDSADEEQRIKATVEDEKKKILASAEQEIAAATTHAQKQLQQYAAGLAIDQAAKKLVISAETDRLLVQGFAQRLAGDESKGQN